MIFIGILNLRLLRPASYPCHRMYETGGKLKEIQHCPGHKNFEIANRIYLHATDAMEHDPVESLKRMYKK